MATIVGDYEYEPKDIIGNGAFAIVFRGKSRKQSDKTVAIKQIAKKQWKSQNLLEKEIKILKELTKLQHENLVALYDCKESPNHVYLVIEYCNGGDLADYLQTRRTLSEDIIAIFFRQIAAGIYACHQQSVVHRDLKPQNILLLHPDQKNPRVQNIVLKIADFGFARFLSDGVMAGTLCGSPMYMAPEVIRSLKYDGKADLWSIGTIMYQCLTGKAAFYAATPTALKDFYEHNVNLVPTIPKSCSRNLADLIIQTLKRDPKERIDFDDFINHPFLRKSDPITIGSSRSSSSSIDVISSSPLREGIVSGGPEVDYNFPRIKNRLIDPIPEIDFDTLPSNVTTPKSATAPTGRNSPLGTRNLYGPKVSSNSPIAIPSKFDLGNIPFRETTNREKNSTGSPALSGSPHMLNKKSPINDVPNRMSSAVTTLNENALPNRSTRTSSVSEPIPVPSQLHNYEKMQETRDRTKSFGGAPSPSPYGSPHDYVERRMNPDLLHRASIASSSSDLANSLSPPAIRYIADSAMLSHSPFSLPPNKNSASTTSTTSTQTLQPWGSLESSTKSQHTLAGIDDFVGPFFEDENDMEFADSNIKGLKNTSATGYQRVNALFADVKLDGQCSQLQQMTDETLMDADHRENIEKMKFILQLVYYIINLGNSKISFLTESVDFMNRNKEKINRPKLDRLSQADQTYKRAEQLTLYVKALHFLSSAMCLARDTLKSGKLQPSNMARNVIHELNNTYKQCLIVCKQLSVQSDILASDEIRSVSITADKLIYLHAIDLCFEAADSEFFGRFQNCIEPYTEAQILFHSLSQQALSESDRLTLRRYREAVERRLNCLKNQGLVMANIAATVNAGVA